MAVSEYGREGEKAFKYTEILESDVDIDNLFGDLVDHWIRYESWEEERMRSTRMRRHFSTASGMIGR